MTSFRLLLVIILVLSSVSAQAADCVGRFGPYDLALHHKGGKVILIWSKPGNSRPSYRADFVPFQGNNPTQKYVFFRTDMVLDRVSGTGPVRSEDFQAIALTIKGRAIMLQSSSAVAIVTYPGTSYVTLEDKLNETILRCRDPYQLVDDLTSASALE